MPPDEKRPAADRAEDGRPPDARAPSFRPSRRDAVLLGLLLVLAWAVYRPDIRLPFDYVDFPENIRVLQTGESFTGRFDSLMAVYRDHGRWSPVIMGLWAAQWSWFEWWTPGWQLLRFLLCFGVAGLAYLLFRRLHLRPLGAFTGTMLLVVSPAAVLAWTRLSTAEPQGTLFLLAGCHLALGSRRGGPAWGVGLAGMLLCLMWTKEIMIFAFALPAYLAIAANAEGWLGPVTLDRRARSALRAIAVALVIGAIPILLVYFTSPADSFAARYGSGGASPTGVAGSILSALLPFAPVSDGSPAVVLAAPAALAVLFLAGWSRSLRADAERPHHRRLILLALALPVLGALIYTPWPFYVLVYAFPFIAAGALLVGQAASALAGAGVPARALVAGCLAIVLSFGVAQAFNESARTRAIQQAVAASVIRVSEYSKIDSVHVAVARDQYDHRGNFGPRFWVYARAMGRAWPHVRDIPCEEASSLPAPGTLVLKLNVMCKDGRSSTDAMTFRYRRVAWPDPRPRPDSVRVDLIQSATLGAQP